MSIKKEITFLNVCHLKLVLHTRSERKTSVNFVANKYYILLCACAPKSCKHKVTKYTKQKKEKKVDQKRFLRRHSLQINV